MKLEKYNFIIAENSVRLKNHEYDIWYKNNITGDNGIWIGNGISDQYLIDVNSSNKDIENKKIKEQENINKANEIKNKLKNVTLEFKVKCNNDKVFGSISSKQIHEELAKLGFNVDKKCIKINGSISSLGMHIVTLNLHKKVVGELKVHLIEK